MNKNEYKYTLYYILSMVLFECKRCNYTTILKANYNRHNKSNKHLTNINANSPTPILSNEAICKPYEAVCKPVEAICKPFEAICKPPNKYTCEYCDKIYNHRQSLSKHIKYTCKKNKDEDLKELVRLLNLQLEQQRSESAQQLALQHKQLDNQQKQIDKLMEKLQVPQINNTQNIVQNNIRLSYKDTDLSHLTHADYINSINKIVMCVKNFVEIAHLDPAHPENMNVFISNLKDKYIMVYTGETWELKNRQYELSHMYEHNEMLLSEWLNEFGTKELREKFEKYLSRKEGAFNMIQEEIKLMFYNKRHMVEAICE